MKLFNYSKTETDSFTRDPQDLNTIFCLHTTYIFGLMSNFCKAMDVLYNARLVIVHYTIIH